MLEVKHPAPKDSDSAQIAADIDGLRAEFTDKLSRLVAIPSVSMQPERHDDVRRCAALACAYLREAGVDARIIATQGLPLVWGKLILDPKLPTVTIYNHLDVQPADGEGWRAPPFEPRVVGDRLFGRGATDDKGPALAALLASRLALARGVRLNFQFLWECEEEVGSPSFARALAKLVREHGLKTDSILVSDTIWPAAGQPAIPYGLRGLVALLIRLETGEKDVHSGTTGGAARNPVGELAALIARLYDARTGRVRIPGFYAGTFSRRNTVPGVQGGVDLGRWLVGGCIQVARGIHHDGIEAPPNVVVDHPYRGGISARVCCKLHDRAEPICDVDIS